MLKFSKECKKHAKRVKMSFKFKEFAIRKVNKIASISLSLSLSLSY